jgi:4-hydroxyphenylpyruvate dioxygenase
LADAPLMSMDVLQWSRHHRLFPGQGEFDLPRFVDHVLTASYAGPLSLEVFNDVFRQSAPVHTAVDALRSLLVLEESVARGSPQKAVASGLTCPPPVPTLSGHAFVELTADAGAVSEVARALTSFGFTKTGSHRSSNTQLWQQGDARILLNESTGTATGVTEITSLGSIPIPSNNSPHARRRFLLPRRHATIPERRSAHPTAPHCSSAIQPGRKRGRLSTTQ